MEHPSLQELYKQTLLRHSKRPLNARELPEATARASLRNPLCGDEVTVYIKLSAEAVSELSFVGQCCSICTASASMMTARLAGSPSADALATASELVAALRGADERAALEGELAALSGVRGFPSRIRCATLPWEALIQVLNPQSGNT